MSLIVYAALLAAAYMAWRHGAARALLAVYLPMLLLIPDAFRAITPGLPDPNFNQAAIIPVAIAAALSHGRFWRPAPLDLLMILFALCVAWSDYSARGYDAAQNLVFAMLCSVIGPYTVARLLTASDPALHVRLARRIVALVFVVGLIGVWEARFGYNPFMALIGPLFPGQGTGWVTTFRHGMARVAGPFSHAILAGIMMAITYRLHRWLQQRGEWQREPLPGMGWLPWAPDQVMRVALLAALFMTVARGPWLGALVGSGIAHVAMARNPRRAIWLSVAGLLLGGLIGGALLANYLDISPGQAMTMSQESALYRKVLFQKYFDIALDHMWFGWGLTDWPKVPGMESIDNYYLLLSLMHGLPAMLLLVAMLLGGALLCLRKALREPPRSHSLGYTFAAIFVLVFVSLGTVYMGEQVLPMLFLTLGWAQGWLLGAPLPSVAPRVSAAPPPPQAKPDFRHVIS